MITHEDLTTINIIEDLTSRTVNKLRDSAVIYEEEGMFGASDGDLEELTLEILKAFKQETDLSVDLKRAYNNYIRAKQKYEFSPAGEETDEDTAELYEAEQALANELLDYHADPETYVIVHVEDPNYYEEAWFLCYLEDIQDLRIAQSIEA